MLGTFATDVAIELQVDPPLAEYSREMGYVEKFASLAVQPMVTVEVAPTTIPPDWPFTVTPVRTGAVASIVMLLKDWAKAECAAVSTAVTRTR